MKAAQCGQSQSVSVWERQSIWRSHWCTLPCSSMSNHLRSWVPEYQSTGSISVVLFTASRCEHPSPNHSAEKTNTQQESLRGQRKASQFRSQCNPLWMTFLSGLSVCLSRLIDVLWVPLPLKNECVKILILNVIIFGSKSFGRSQFMRAHNPRTVLVPL